MGLVFRGTEGFGALFGELFQELFEGRVLGGFTAEDGDGLDEVVVLDVESMLVGEQLDEHDLQFRGRVFAHYPDE